ncbi:hypothetical protein BJ170DRAFT_183820 [Xylariales sp. AK1849]|nr:hypothetical protein BJ170DRAFT_183820 [Xylariales sp. AK1849]
MQRWIHGVSREPLQPAPHLQNLRAAPITSGVKDEPIERQNGGRAIPTAPDGRAMREQAWQDSSKHHREQLRQERLKQEDASQEQDSSEGRQHRHDAPRQTDIQRSQITPSVQRVKHELPSLRVDAPRNLPYNYCFSCNRPRVDRACDLCKQVTYCSRNCQRVDCRGHSVFCSKQISGS